MLEQLRRLNADTSSLDDLLSLNAFGKSLKAEYLAAGAEAPEWLVNRLEELDRAIAVAFADRRAKELKEIDAQLSTLETAAEKRAKLTARKAELTGAGRAVAGATTNQ